MSSKRAEQSTVVASAISQGQAVPTELVPVSSSEDALMPSGEAQILSLSAFQDLIKRNGARIRLRTTVALEYTQGIIGIFVGEGPPIELANGEENVNPVTGEVTRKSMRTWLIDQPGAEGRPTVRYELVGKYQLDRFFKSLSPGTRVMVFRLADDVRVAGGRTVGAYHCAEVV
jgi:hypothetical protein